MFVSNQGGQIGRRCDFKIFSPKNLAKKIGVFDSKYCLFMQKMISTLIFKKNAQSFLRKWGIIAEICDRNIYPRFG
jgi:hypothetical protein